MAFIVVRARAEARLRKTTIKPEWPVLGTSIWTQLLRLSMMCRLRHRDFVQRKPKIKWHPHMLLPGIVSRTSLWHWNTFMRTLHRYGAIVQYSTVQHTLLYSLVDVFWKYFMQWESFPCIVRLVHFKENSEVLLVFAYRGFTLIFHIWSWGNPNNFNIFILNLKLKFRCLELGGFLGDQTLHGCMGMSTYSVLCWVHEMAHIPFRLIEACVKSS